MAGDRGVELTEKNPKLAWVLQIDAECLNFNLGEGRSGMKHCLFKEKASAQAFLNWLKSERSPLATIDKNTIKTYGVKVTDITNDTPPGRGENIFRVRVSADQWNTLVEEESVKPQAEAVAVHRGPAR